MTTSETTITIQASISDGMSRDAGSTVIITADGYAEAVSAATESDTITLEQVEIAESRGACDPAIEWLREEPRTWKELVEQRTSWAQWAYKRGLIPQEIMLQWKVSGDPLRKIAVMILNLHGADLRCAYLRNADLQGADFEEADLTDAELVYADLQDANLQRAKLQGARLVGADLRGVNLWEADLREADLTEADLQDAILA